MRHLVFDTETTNLVHNSLQPMHKQPQIIEFFGLVLDDEKDWAEVEKFDQLFNPGKKLPQEVIKITSITDDMLKDAPAFLYENSDVQKLIEGVDVVVAHNLSYDMSVTDFEFKRAGKKIKWPSRRVCTVEATEHMKGYRLNLGALHQELFGETFSGAHRAENDVRALARCYIELVKRGEV